MQETNAGSQIKALAPSHPLTGSGHLGSYPGAFDRAAMVDRPSQVAISQKGRGVVETVGSGMEKKRVGAAEPKYADTMTAGGSVKEARRGDRAMFWTRYENTEYDRDDHDVY